MDINKEQDDLLPEEIEEMQALERAKIQEQIESIGMAIAGYRKKAIDGRQQSGIEDEWLEAEEAYQGVDNANRQTTKGYKPPHPSGTPVFHTPAANPDRSTLLLNITRPYTDGASARVGDMLLPTDDRNWGIKPSPIPDMPKQMPPAGVAGQLPLAGPAPSLAAPPPGPAPVAPQPGQMPQPMAAMPPSPEDQAEQTSRAAREAAAKAQKQIEDWHVECSYPSEMRKLIEDCSKLGVGVLKGPYPVKRKKMRAIQVMGATQIEMVESISPASKCISPWNFYPDPACGDDIHSGKYCFERDDITGRKLKELIGLPGYLSEQIEAVLQEGPGKKYAESALRNTTQRPEDEGFEIWYYTGFMDREDLEPLNIDLEDLDELVSVPTIVTLVNDRPIRVTLNPLDSGEFPYDAMPWQRRAGFWAGIGIPKQIEPAQRMVTSAVRNMLDNAGISGGPILGFRDGVVEPLDGKWTLTPRKMYRIKQDADVRSIRDAIDAIIIPSNQAEMLNIINFGLSMAEQITGLPLMMQGMQGSAPDTLGGQQIFQNNASTVLRRIARNYDDCVTTRHIRRYYAYLLAYAEDESAKGDFIIDARGSSALVERELQNQSIFAMGQMLQDPAFGISKKKWIKEWLKSQRLDPERYEMDEGEKQALTQQQPPMAPQVQAAQIRAQVDMERAKMQNQTEQFRIKVDTDRDTAYVQAEQQRNQVDAMARREELMLRREIAYLEAQMRKGINLDENKVKLATKAAELRTTRELAMLNVKASLLPKPPVEPPGRAAPGKSFTQ